MQKVSIDKRKLTEKIFLLFQYCRALFQKHGFLGYVWRLLRKISVQEILERRRSLIGENLVPKHYAIGCGIFIIIDMKLIKGLHPKLSEVRL